MKCAAAFSFLSLAASSAAETVRSSGRKLAADAFIFSQHADGFAKLTNGFTQSDKEGFQCSTSEAYVSFVAGVGEETGYMQISTNKWHSGGYRIDCMDKGAHTGYKCAATCSPFPNPNFKDWTYLTFEARVSGSFDPLLCKPSIKLLRRWPMDSSQTLELVGDLVEGGSLIGNDWKIVVIPVENFATTAWPDVNGVKDIYFLNCAANSNPTYQVRRLKLTDIAPSITQVAVTPSPSAAPSAAYWSIWETAEDSHTFESADTTCFEQLNRLGITTSNDNGLDFFTITPDSWVAGGLRLGCVGKDENYQCNRSCFPFDTTTPDWSGKLYLTMLAKVEGDMTDSCKPTITMTGGGWPRLTSTAIQLEDSYVNAGQLTSYEWRRVFIPLEDFKTSEWDLSSMYAIYFQTCGTGHSGAQPTYQIASLAVTNNVYDVVPIPDSAAPSVPTEAYWSVWENIEDSHALENANTTCFEQLERLGITTSTDNDGLDFFTITPDPWVSGGLRFGCVGKDENYQCNRSCFPFDTTTPDWSDKLYLTMLAKVEGGITATCKPTITLSGGGWPRHASNAIILEESYVDAGYLTSDEWRRVLIPLENFKTAEWDLSNMYGMYFQRCPNHSGAQPTYHIASVAITNTAIDLVSTPPSSAPSAYTTDDPLLATHRIVHPNHHNWWPIFGADREPAGNFWVTAENNAWPSVPATTNPQTATVYIPAGQSVFYSGADTVKYDKIIVEGSLTIQPFNADVSLIVSTIVVEEGGSLDILTEATSSNTVEIQIEGALDFIVDPEQVLLGIIGLSGNVTIQGNEVQTKMATLYQDANAGTPYFVVGGMNLGFAVGGELVLPDTQTDLDVGHYLFGRSSYVDQTETCTIVSIDSHAVGVEETTITCDSPLAFNHSLGSNAAYVSRSIHILTSPASTDRGHILHTGTGKFEVRNACIEGFGRTTTELIDSTVMSPTDLKFGTQDTSHLIKQFEVEHIGVNQVARYAVHAHHSRVEAYLTGLAIIQSPRDGMVAHDSRVHILNNVIVGADGAGIFLEDGTETGPVKHNYIIGTGGGTRGGDDGRFSIQKGKDMAHGGFGIWARGKLALVQGNHAEGHFGFAAYSFFVHPNFISDKVVPDVPGTPSILVGKKRKDIPGEPDGTGLHLQTYGGFIDNTAAATFKVGIDMSYFSSSLEDTVGSIIEGARIRNLAKSGFGLKTTHSRIFTLNDVVIEGTVSDNTIIGIWCNNLNCGPGCMLQTPNTTLIFNNVQEERDGNSC